MKKSVLLYTFITLGVAVYGQTIDYIFPINGVTLGKTTSRELKRLGKLESSDADSGTGGYNINGMYVGSDEEAGLAIAISLHKNWYDDEYSDVMPQRMAALGMSWDLSYKEWIDLAMKLKWDVEITRSPYRDEDGDIWATLIFSNGERRGLRYSIYLFFHYEDGIIGKFPMARRTLSIISIGCIGYSYN
jgi:hypothetical protein